MNKNYIPTINISSLIKNNFETQSAFKTIKEIEKACVNIGFFQVTGHGLNLKEIKNICDVGNKFFNLPEMKKRKLSPKKWNKKNKNLYRGYFPNDVNGKEGLDIGDLKITKKYSSKIKNQYIEYLDLNICFNKTSIRALNKYFENIYNLSETLFKSVIKAVLYQDKKGGLQVQNRKTKKWYDVPFNKKALVVNTGRALEFLSRGKFKATNHRVLWNKSKRLSIPFFFEPSYDFKMNRSFLNSKKYSNTGQIYEKFLNQSLKKFIEYQR